MNYIGIDPGKTGAIAVIDKNDNVLYCELYVDFIKDINSLLIKLGSDNKACIEKVHAMPKQGVCSVFTFGENFGFHKGFLTRSQIPYEEVTPKTWQKELIPGVAAIKNRKERKIKIVEYCMKKFPTVDFSLKKYQDKADALCIALYGKRFL